MEHTAYGIAPKPLIRPYSSYEKNLHIYFTLNKV